ncbi:quinoprotein dehydrogenase-associated SoxYZ-like carrier [Sedimentitalea arenosa]|uniref:Quinoprotein dehydrogenase-associated SoxYZ-like carrier n=1 Tax=Sedimentitalea arenosa TaxID=2798803 RepID=A0A8J7IMB0_9RHOB|nr:quinoprotein dehydrogenase-associated SoxYZ-like carrier [Arenibacterium arenosum]MBJ6373323.1 quinoprotein dehydrogenase-associated SoxYZ-like carrier [Arenibacterium arenosum]
MKPLVLAMLVAMLAQAALAQDGARDNPLIDGPTWQELRDDFVPSGTDVRDGAALFTVDAPYRANDAATVPVVIRQVDPTVTLRKAQVIIDENPAPMAADLTFGDRMQPVDFELRVRIDQYSNVRVLATTEAGTFMSGRFVKASGGCSAPATKDPTAALASMGQMRLKHFDESDNMSGQRRDAQIMIRHPNYSGLQRDQITQLFVSAHFIDSLEVYQGEELLFSLEGGISVSENPVFRFVYTDNGAPTLTVRAHDTEGNLFEQVLPKSVQS